MKIGIFTDTYYPQLNGVTTSIDNFTKELRSLGHTVYIFAPKIKGYTDTDKQVFRMPSFKVLSSEPEIHFPLPTVNKSLREIYRHDFDIVHAHGNGAFSLIGIQVARMKGVPYILTFHTLHAQYTHYILNGKVVKPRMVAAAFRILGNRCDGVVTPSEKMKRELIKYGVKKQIEVVPNFINSAPFHLKKNNFLQERLQLPKNARVLLSVGRIGKEKNFEFLISMFKKLALVEKNSHLVIVGRGTHLEKLKKAAGKLLDKRIHFPGLIVSEEMPRVYTSADMFVFSSTSEVHPMVVLEAAAAGLPFVMVNDLAFKNILIDGENGYALPLDKDKFIEKIKKLLGDSDLRREFGENSRKIIKKNFDGKVVAKRLVTFYELICGEYDPRIKFIRRINKATMRRVIRATQMLNRFLSI